MRTMRRLTGLVLACTLGALPSCATMGGGGMKYLMDLPTATTYQA
jgi:hypothetical protein